MQLNKSESYHSHSSELSLDKFHELRRKQYLGLDH